MSFLNNTEQWLHEQRKLVYESLKEAMVETIKTNYVAIRETKKARNLSKTILLSSLYKKILRHHFNRTNYKCLRLYSLTVIVYTVRTTTANLVSLKN